jgi:TonB family protein
VPAFAAVDAAALDALRAKLVGKTVYIRGFYRGDKLHFDVAGQPVGAVSAGVWSVDGPVHVDRVNLRHGSVLEIEGVRQICIFDSEAHSFTPEIPKQHRKIKLEAELGPSVQHEVALNSAVRKLLLLERSELGSAVPEYWRYWLEDSTKTPANGVLPQHAEAGSAQQRDGEECYQIGKGVRPPKITSRRDPEFSGTARAMGIQGTLVLRVAVDKRGVPHVMGIQRALGAGLDEKAVESVEIWRFIPGERNGEAVNVEVTVEVSFHLYR